METEKKYTLITGATSGIGYELAKLFGAMGHHLILVARGGKELEEKAAEFRANYKVEVIVIQKNLFLPEAPFEIYDEIADLGLIVNVLVNDAGQGQYGLFAENDIHRYLEIIQLNIGSLTSMTHLFLKDMLRRNDGRILQLASIASEAPGPYQAVYHATKAYVLSFTEALINEISDTNVTMTALQPGITNTDFFNKAGMQRSKAVQDKSKMADPAAVAKDGVAGLMSKKDKFVSGWKNKIQTAIGNLVPETMLADQVGKQQEPVEKSVKNSL